MPRSLLQSSYEERRCNLYCPVAMPKAGTFLWNTSMLRQVNCHGFAAAQYMHPEPCKYSHAALLEQQTFMRPEQPYCAHHPGRFVYIKDELNNAVYSVPYEPVRETHERFVFSARGRALESIVSHSRRRAGPALSGRRDVVDCTAVSKQPARRPYSRPS